LQPIDVGANGDWIMVNIYQTAAFNARRTPDHLALCDGGESLNFSDLVVQSRRVAAAIEALGVKRGDRVAALLPNSILYVLLYHAAAVSGFILVPVNTRYGKQDLSHLVADCTPGLVLFDSQFQKLVDEARAGLASSSAGEAAPDWQDVSEVDWQVGPFGGGDPLVAAYGTVEAEDTALIIYTSGTTGAPKGAMISHANMVWNATNHAVELSVSSHHRSILAAPLFHIAGYNVLNGPILYAGGSLHVLAKFDVDEVLSAIQSHDPTHLFLLSTMWVYLTDLDGFQDLRFPNVEYVQTAASPLSARREEIIRAVFPNAEFGWGFGMTEYCVTSIKNRTTQELLDHPGALGYVWRHFAYRLVSEDGQKVDLTGPGELQIKGPNVFKGYWNAPEATAEVFTEDGWMRTGDRMRFDADGYAYFEGRLKDMIKTGGENVAALEVEQVLMEYDSISQAAVFGLEHPVWGEELVAAILPTNGAAVDPERVRAFCKSRLSGFKVPKRIWCVEEMPVSSSGKVQKHLLKQRFQ